MSTTKLTIGYLYKEEMNLYGDNGNIEVMLDRARRRGIQTEVIVIDTTTNPNDPSLKGVNFMFMGGGSDYSQRETYQDFITNKKQLLQSYVEEGKTGLYICGAYQLMGNYYKSADGSVLKGLEIFDIYTQHFGYSKQRCTGNVLAELTNSAIKGPTSVVGFENHGGRTYLGTGCKPFATLKFGFGNNGEDNTEGLLYKNSLCTYLHGPLVARNPHIADYLLAKALNVDKLEQLDDSLIYDAHTASTKLKQ
ncbi:hypothetical protein A3K34_04475 [candidate division WWE3 bacterium RIFOXYC1_FULL_40_10]|uniref:Lipid II isoglutaminyl synthase (glutamine-hydrolyzing) subunit GatD n=1 Tax=candidate division WWE3 bacterium RIFOXYA2_FULL_46_9 TaxID=1802636 RepID=A0A1F4W235_UNCKA|nr:MAG: hypothetical protein A3K58_04475 [candidate division WWE3 bacterium RIFOXYB1_FULL_40_22]OGC62098.1 MAG: hypothetical protein A3K37_04475 [candidate division WWE3 bacterium RIFOXYA1_FULL_40_11]OGC63113.1 MAG: hypothetical protein A2264_00220 [candidate division WWE3 bacterium RIFOXYA2_FULL_46_9]OGC64959.1 MAG: hypothetical protein A2326_02890 [candidate division WWE3 bacterium RIFOXYB2_FULL_41_6]OGC66481.1 MAG: hypothetical protein A3K34_04475 [candidate division WWE3 bacterium RIFOXYC1_